MPLAAVLDRPVWCAAYRYSGNPSGGHLPVVKLRLIPIIRRSGGGRNPDGASGSGSSVESGAPVEVRGTCDEGGPVPMA